MTKKYKIKEVNPIRIFAYSFMVLLFILSTINTIITVPNLIYDGFNLVNDYSKFFMLKTFGIGLAFGLMNVFILYRVSSTNPLEVVSNIARKRIRLSIYIINTLMFLFLTLLLTVLIFIDIENIADLVSNSEEYSVLMFVLTNSLIAAGAVNITLFSLSLPSREKK